MKSFLVSFVFVFCVCAAGAQENVIGAGANATITTTTTATQDIANTTPPLPVRLPPAEVTVNKCCHYGESLDETQTCIAGNSEHWVPLIYLINRRTTYTKGEAPKFMHFEENVRPVINRTDNDTDGEGCTLSDLELFSGKDKIIIFSNASLFLRERAQLIEPKRYCVDRDAALVCFASASHKQSALPSLKLQKCCGKNGNYDAAANKCNFKQVTGNGKLQLSLNESSYQTIYGFPTCAISSYAIVADWHDAKLNLSTGELQLSHKNLSSSEYCLEHLKHDASSANNIDNSDVKIFACLHHFSPAGIVLSADESTSSRLQIAALRVGLVISVIFLAATLFAGCLMPSVHHVLHWRCQIYYVFCLFVGEFLLAFTELSDALQLRSPACLFVASCMQFFFLSAFFWLNTMCFNIWWTFRDFRPSSLERNQELLRLRLYSVYAWGVPLLICIIAVCVDQLPDSQLIRPDFGVTHCWFSNEHLSIFAYFFAPIGILLCANIMLFLSTTHQLTCGLWKRDDVKTSTEKTALGKVCLKLVVVMGVTWITDIVSWLVGGPHSAWFFTDLVNALQGVFIFIVVGCQPQVWSACKRFCCPRSRQEITNTTNGGQHSSSSQGLPSMAACGNEITQNTSVGTTITTTAPSSISQTKIPMETVC